MYWQSKERGGQLYVIGYARKQLREYGANLP